MAIVRSDTCAIRLPRPVPRPLRTLCDVAVLLTFAGLVTMRGPASPGTMGALLAMLGIAFVVRETGLTREDMRMAALFAVLPLYHVLNMACTGWDSTLLDKPGRLLFAFLVYLALSRVGVSASSLRWGSVAGSIAAAALSAYQGYVLDFDRAHGAMNAIPFGNYSLLLAALAVAACVVSPRAERSAVLTVSTLIAVAAGLYASFASGTRGGWVMIPVLAWILALGAADGHRRAPIVVPAVMFGLLAVTVVLVSALNERTLAELAGVRQVLTASSSEIVTISLSSIGARIHLYRIGIDAFLSSPLTGIGFANLPGYLAEGAAAGAINPAVVNFTHLHSSIVDTLARGGMLGMLALGGFGLGFIRHFYGALLSSADRDARYFALAGLLSIVAALLFSLTNVLFPAIVGTNILVMTLAIPAGALAYRLRREAESASPQQRRSPV